MTIKSDLNAKEADCSNTQEYIAPPSGAMNASSDKKQA